MIVSTLLASLVWLGSFSQPVMAEMRITADHFSFGGVNYPMLQFFTPQHRDETIREIIKSGARVIRLFSEYVDDAKAVSLTVSSSSTRQPT